MMMSYVLISQLAQVHDPCPLPAIIQPLTVGTWNSVVTSSIDRTVKVWNMNYIFEQVHHIDRHELPIDSTSVCTR